MTNETTLKSVIINNCEINVIDTQGFYDSNGNEKDNLEQMVSFLQQYQKGINLIVITLNSNNIRLSEGIKIIFQKIYQMFGTKKLVDHICFVYTFFYQAIFDDADKKRLLKYTQDVRDIFVSITGCLDLIEIPSFFIDSKPKTKDPSSAQQIQLLLETSFKNLCLPTSSLYPIDPNIKEKICERRKHQIIEKKEERNGYSVTYSDQKRNKLIFWNGTIGYDDWINENYEIIQTRRRKQQRTECVYHSSQSLFGISSTPHTHYTLFIRFFDEQKITHLDQAKNEIDSTDWEMDASSFIESPLGEGQESGHNRTQGIIDLD